MFTVLQHFNFFFILFWVFILNENYLLLCYSLILFLFLFVQLFNFSLRIITKTAATTNKKINLKLCWCCCFSVMLSLLSFYYYCCCFCFLYSETKIFLQNVTILWIFLLHHKVFYSCYCCFFVLTLYIQSCCLTPYCYYNLLSCGCN